MGRHPSNTEYLTPIKQSDSSPAALAGSVPAGFPAGSSSRGWYTLTNGTRYLIQLGGKDCPLHSCHVQWDNQIIITSITVEDSNANPEEASDVSIIAGDWIDEDPATAFVGTVGAGVTVTNGVVAVAGGAIGGCMFHISNTSAKRTRLNVLVGGTGGIARFAPFGKE